MNYCFRCRFPDRKILLLAFSCILLFSCLKTKDNTQDGPKSQVAFTNYAVNGSVNILFDNNALTPAPVGFGGSIATATGGYMPLAPGLHNLRFLSGTNAAADHTVSLITGNHYSLFCYDTLQDKRVKTILLTDDLSANDTIGKARFLQFIPGADTVTLTFKKDALTIAAGDLYVGNKTGVITAVDFSLVVPPGIYTLSLTRKASIVALQPAVTITAGKIYTIIAKGVENGSGEYKESISVVQHN